MGPDSESRALETLQEGEFKTQNEKAVHCQHDWEVQTEFSKNEYSRFRCKLCECWGYQKFEARRKPIRLYRANGKFVFAPKDDWRWRPNFDPEASGYHWNQRLRDAQYIELILMAQINAGDELFDTFNQSVRRAANLLAYDVVINDPLLRAAGRMYLNDWRSELEPFHPTCSNGRLRYAVYVGPRKL